MTNRRVFVRALIAVTAAFGFVASVALADPPKPGETKKPKHQAAAPKPRPAAATAKPSTSSPKEATKRPTESAAAPTSQGAQAGGSHEVVEHESRIEFDERMVHGQSAAGAIFLFQRAPSDFKSIVDVPDSFRERTVELVQPRRGSP